MRFFAVVALVGAIQGAKLTIDREVYRKSAAYGGGVNYQIVQSSTDQEDFKREIAQAQKDSAKFQQQIKEQEAKQAEMDKQSAEQSVPKKMPQGKLMEDGLIHTSNGEIYFQDGRKVDGVNNGQDS